ncbi:MAG: MgtC/SapB family protein [bacterium]|nr:MgtC/SapB family protein [bacterium]
MITEVQIVTRLLVTALLAGLVGFERQRHSQPAGLRTHIILALGAALAMCISVNLALQFKGLAPNGDPARLAAQVISGIGFLGAGAILRYGASVKGITTAASLWTVAIIGLAVGAGHYFSGIATTALALIVLIILDQIEKRYIGGQVLRTLSVKARDRFGLVDDVKGVLERHGIDVKSISLAKDVEQGEMEIEVAARVPATGKADAIFFSLSSIKDVRSVEVH